MNCPDCGKQMQVVVYDDQSMMHCYHCNGSFFEDNIINRISLETAQQLALTHSLMEAPFSAALKKCPKDDSVMLPIPHSEALPQSITLFHCGTCHGVFSTAPELVKFKKAQQIKVEYHKIWELPLPRLQSVLIIFIFTVLSGAVFIGANTAWKTASYKSEARELLQHIKLFRSGRYMLISFSTTTKFRSDVIFKSGTSQEVVRPVMKNPSTTHVATLSDLPITADTLFKIRLTDVGGKITETEYTTLELK